MKKKKVRRSGKKVLARKPERTIEMSFKTKGGGYVRHKVDDFTNG